MSEAIEFLFDNTDADNDNSDDNDLRAKLKDRIATAQQNREKSPFTDKSTRCIKEQNVKVYRNTVAMIIDNWHSLSEMYAPRTLKELYCCLCQLDTNMDNESKHKNTPTVESSDHMRMTVEWAGSGKVLSYGFMLLKAEPVKNLGTILGSLLPPNPRYRSNLHRVFHGHGGKELTSLAPETNCGDVLHTGDLLVIFPGAKSSADILHGILTGWGIHENAGDSSSTRDSIACAENSTDILKLELFNRHITGYIPTEIGDLIDLTYLNVSKNKFTGCIPSEIGLLINLKYIYLEENKLTGLIPTEIGLLIHLRRLELNKNSLIGIIPSDIEHLTDLKKINLGWNRLTGCIPTELGRLINLKELWLNENRLTGCIPTELGRLIKLKKILLRCNQLTGIIPAEIGGLFNVTVLSLNSNKLTGVIPSEIGRLINLKIIHLENNDLNGFIPAEIGELISLRELNIGDNKLNDKTGFKAFMKAKVPYCSVNFGRG